MLGIAPDPDAAIPLPEIKMAETKRTVRPKVRKASWEKSVALAVSGNAGRQTDAEERVVMRARNALQRAVSTREAQQPVAAALRSSLERRFVAQ